MKERKRGPLGALPAFPGLGPGRGREVLESTVGARTSPGSGEARATELRGRGNPEAAKVTGSAGPSLVRLLVKPVFSH